jgi:hypothetical protein
MRDHLLCTGCTPLPELKVKMRDWFPARGWAGSLSLGKRAILVLSTNPGHPLKVEEEIWRNWPTTVGGADAVSQEQANEQLKLVWDLYSLPKGKSRGRTAFHTRSVKLARALLWLVDRAGKRSVADWRNEVWFSDVVKCSTATEMGSRGIGTLSKACWPNLQQELEQFEPSIVIALGESADNALKSAGFTGKWLRGPHPSGRGWRKVERTNEGKVQALFENACDMLKLDYKSIEDEFLRVRKILGKDAWAMLPVVTK